MAAGVGGVGIWATSGLWEEDGKLRGDGADAAAELEELGYGAVWLGRANGDLGLAERLLDTTNRLVVGTSIVNIWMYGPQLVASSYSRVSARHRDRLLVGLGVGHAPAVEATGQRYERPVHKMRQYLDALDAADPALPKEARALAALGPRVLQLAGQRSAGALPYLTPPEHTTQARAILGPGPLLVAEQKVVLDSDPVSARALSRRGVARYFRLQNYASNLTRLGFTDDDLAGNGSDRLVDAVVAWGHIDAIVQRVREHLDAGADQVAIQVLTDAVNAGTSLPRAEWRALAPALGPLASPRPAR
jgi:probable F420-dependent oxidoreductase